MKRLLVVVGLGLLVGCASKPAPEATQEQYTFFVLNKMGAQKCMGRGDITPEQSAEVLYYFDWAFRNVRLNPLQLNVVAAKIPLDLQPTKAQCDSIIQNKEKFKLDHAQFQRNLAIPAPSMNLPTQTNCSTYFGQTHCTSY